jgi:hypothetical protein
MAWRTLSSPKPTKVRLTTLEDGELHLDRPCAFGRFLDTRCRLLTRFSWTRLLLRYVSRDELTLLDRGAGGVPELRNAIDGYEETAPLYGFLQYRRRKVVISYMPQGLSRLVQGTSVLLPRPPS